MMKYLRVILMIFIVMSCEEIIEVEDISSKTVTVLVPSDAVTLNIANINFYWDSVEDAEQYKLQIVSPSFEMANQIVLDTTITVTSFRQALEPGIYGWRIRAENSGYQTVYSTQSFTVE